MAQAARLNLRMQKELKLLLTDPPHGASFPFLSVDSDLASLSTIHARIEGPEETVYAKGIFEVKIQIPERYPFQPPSVTFVTPIYHPNIDNGGRICLDILNLPPKGAWRPSLNISTVLTSIGLLLSEPNPDDGLMCEASQEYKYNRQAFERKARSLTEKYAKAGAGVSNCSTQCTQNLHPGTTELAGSKESGQEVDEFVSVHEKSGGITQKLSLESSSSIKNRDSKAGVNEMEAKRKREEVNSTLDKCNLRQEKLCGTRRKLSLESSWQIQKRNGHEKENIVANQSSLPTISTGSSQSSTPQHNICSQQKHYHQPTSESIDGSRRMRLEEPCEFKEKKLFLDTSLVSEGNNEKIVIESQVMPSQTHSNALHGSSSTALLVNSNELQPHKDFIDRIGNRSTNTIYKRTSSVGTKKLSLGLKGSSQEREKDNKDNVLPIHKLPVSSPKSSSRSSGIGQILSLGPPIQLQGNNDNNIQLFSQNLSMDAPVSSPLKQHHGRNEEWPNLDEDAKGTGENEQPKIGPPISEAVIVLDSEDSEDERDGALRSKLSLAHKRRVNSRAKA